MLLNMKKASKTVISSVYICTILFSLVYPVCSNDLDYVYEVGNDAIDFQQEDGIGFNNEKFEYVPLQDTGEKLEVNKPLSVVRYKDVSDSLEEFDNHYRLSQLERETDNKTSGPKCLKTDNETGQCLDYSFDEFQSGLSKAGDYVFGTLLVIIGK